MTSVTIAVSQHLFAAFYRMPVAWPNFSSGKAFYACPRTLLPSGGMSETNSQKRSA